MRGKSWLICSVVGLAFMHSVSRAQHLDIMLYREGNELRSGGFDFGALPSVLVNYNVFSESLIHIPVAAPGVGFTSAPGWNALSLPDELPAGGQTLPGLADLFVSGPVLPQALSGRNLGYWSGVGVPSFGPMPSDEILVHSVPDAFGGGRFVIYDGSTNAVPSFMIGDTGPSGGLHNHPSYALFGNSQRNGQSPDAPSTGVYLIALQASMVDHVDAPPVYVLFGFNVSPSVRELAKIRVRSIVDPTLLPGDANLDDAVDFADLVSLARNYNSTGKTWFDGDFDFDGEVSFSDLVALARNYSGQSLAANNSFSPLFQSDWQRALAIVPEPGVLMTASIGLLLARRSRRENRKQEPERFDHSNRSHASCESCVGWSNLNSRQIRGLVVAAIQR